MNTADLLLLRKIETAVATGEPAVLSLRERGRLRVIVHHQRAKAVDGAMDGFEAPYQEWARLAGVQIRAERPKGLPTQVTPRARKRRRR